MQYEINHIRTRSGWSTLLFSFGMLCRRGNHFNEQDFNHKKNDVDFYLIPTLFAFHFFACARLWLYDVEFRLLHTFPFVSQLNALFSTTKWYKKLFVFSSCCRKADFSLRILWLCAKPFFSLHFHRPFYRQNRYGKLMQRWSTKCKKKIHSIMCRWIKKKLRDWSNGRKMWTTFFFRLRDTYCSLLFWVCVATNVQKWDKKLNRPWREVLFLPMLQLRLST